MQGGYEKVAIFDQYLAIARKQLKIDGHMPRRVWPALNSLSIHVRFTAIIPGAYPGEARMCKNVLKWRTFKLTGLITGKRLKIDRYMLRCVSIHVTFKPTAIFPEEYPGEAKMCLRLSWRSQMAAPYRLIAETDARSVGDSHPSCFKAIWHYKLYSRRLSATSCAHYSVHSRTKYSANNNKQNVHADDNFSFLFINLIFILNHSLW